MNILIIHHFGGLGGGTNSCIDLAKIFKILGHNVTVAVHQPSLQLVQLCEKEKIQIIDNGLGIIQWNYHSASHSKIRTLIKFLMSIKSVKKWKLFFGKNDADLVVLNSSVQAPLLPIIKLCNKKSICFIRETCYGNSGSLYNTILKKFLSLANAIIFLSKYDMYRWGIRDTKKQFIIPDVIDEKRFQINLHDISIIKKKFSISKETVILYLGGLSYPKGALDLLKACQQLDEKQKFKLVILGDLYEEFDKFNIIKRFIYKKHIDYRCKCIEIVNAINKKSKNTVILYGLTSDVPSWYSICNYVVFPVKQVHQARPAYEAGLFSKPIVLPNYENFKEYVNDGVNGLLYERDDITSLTRVMSNLNTDSKLQYSLGEANYLEMKEKHSFLVAEELLGFVLDRIKGLC